MADLNAMATAPSPTQFGKNFALGALTTSMACQVRLHPLFVRVPNQCLRFGKHKKQGIQIYVIAVWMVSL
jgi:hypothetical protein